MVNWISSNFWQYFWLPDFNISRKLLNFLNYFGYHLRPECPKGTKDEVMRPEGPQLEVHYLKTQTLNIWISEDPDIESWNILISKDVHIEYLNIWIFKDPHIEELCNRKSFRTPVGSFSPGNCRWKPSQLQVQVQAPPVIVSVPTPSKKGPIWLKQASLSDGMAMVRK